MITESRKMATIHFRTTIRLICHFSDSCVWSSASEMKVPARGKALVPTDLSIAVPEGTYARIGR